MIPQWRKIREHLSTHNGSQCFLESLDRRCCSFLCGTPLEIWRIVTENDAIFFSRRYMFQGPSFFGFGLFIFRGAKFCKNGFSLQDSEWRQKKLLFIFGKNPVISRRCPSKMVWLKMLISSYSSWGNFRGKLMSLQQQPRFYKVADLALSYMFRNKATDSYGSKYWWLQGLALIQGQICNPVLVSFCLPLWGVW